MVLRKALGTGAILNPRKAMRFPVLLWFIVRSVLSLRDGIWTAAASPWSRRQTVFLAIRQLVKDSQRKHNGFSQWPPWN
jgi:hypothetical protein